jgi:hypothetical protein
VTGRIGPSVAADAACACAKPRAQSNSACTVMSIIGGPLRYSSTQSLESPSQMGRLPSVGRARCALPARDRPHADADADAIGVLPASHGTSATHARGSRQASKRQATTTMPMHRARCALPAETGHMRCQSTMPNADADASAIDRLQPCTAHPPRAPAHRGQAGRTLRMHAGGCAGGTCYVPAREPGHTNYTASFRPVARRVSCIHVT